MKSPNPERVYAVIVSILERRYNIKIDYEVVVKTKGENHEHHRIPSLQ